MAKEQQEDVSVSLKEALQDVSGSSIHTDNALPEVEEVPAKSKPTSSEETLRHGTEGENAPEVPEGEVFSSAEVAEPSTSCTIAEAEIPKEVADELKSPVEMSGASLNVKRRLWVVDKNVVNDTLKKELQILNQREIVEKSSQWNFDFDKEVPLKGAWQWEKATEAPGFYQTKEYRSQKKRFSPYERRTTRQSARRKDETSLSNLVTSSSDSSNPVGTTAPLQPDSTSTTPSTTNPDTKDRISSSGESSLHSERGSSLSVAQVPSCSGVSPTISSDTTETETVNAGSASVRSVVAIPTTSSADDPTIPISPSADNPTNPISPSADGPTIPISQPASDSTSGSGKKPELSITAEQLYSSTPSERQPVITTPEASRNSEKGCVSPERKKLCHNERKKSSSGSTSAGGSSPSPLLKLNR